MKPFSQKLYKRHRKENTLQSVLYVGRQYNLGNQTSYIIYIGRFLNVLLPSFLGAL